MKEEIEVGEYVRDEDGLLGKCTSKYSNSVRLDFQDGTIIATVDHKGYKHSFNIIDLIKVGDYVNGYRVDDIENNKILIGDTTKVIEQIVENNDIKEILTHEQYNFNSYRLED